MDVLKGPVDRRLWIATVVAIVAIVAVGILVSRATSRAPSPIGLRLAAAAVVTVLVAAAKIVVGPRAAALTGVIGVLVAVILLVAFA